MRRAPPRAGSAGTSASCEAQKRVPTTTPSAPSINAAASPRPSVMPPAAHSRVCGARLAIRSAISGTRVSVARMPPWPPPSVPCATMTSAPQSMARSASARVCSWQITGMPAALILPANGSGSSKERKIAFGLRAITASRIFGFLAQRPGDEAAADGLVAGRGELALEPVVIVAVAAAEHAEAARARHGRRQLAAGDHVHRRGDDRMRDVEALRQSGRDRHRGLSLSCLSGLIRWRPNAGQRPFNGSWR